LLQEVHRRGVEDALRYRLSILSQLQHEEELLTHPIFVWELSILSQLLRGCRRA